MTEADAEFFFGRGRETAEVIGALAATPDKLPVLLGNSGVGKSSLAQAGVLAALKRQAWPRGGACAESMAGGFSGQPPVVLPFAQAGRRSAQGAGGNVPRHLAIRGNRPRAGDTPARWMEALHGGKATLGDLIVARNSTSPSRPAFFFTSIRARSFTCARSSGSVNASPKFSLMPCLTHACG
jgi:hypothetical protein